MKCTMIFTFQILIIVFVLVQIFAENYNGGGTNVKPRLTIISLRLIVCYFYHIGISNRVKGAYQRLKFIHFNP